VLRVVAITVALNKLVSSIPTTVAGRIHRLAATVSATAAFGFAAID